MEKLTIRTVDSMAYATGLHDVKNVQELGKGQNAEIGQEVSQLSTKEKLETINPNKQEVDIPKLESEIERMNKALIALNTDLQFAMHKETHRLMVQLTMRDDGKVIKEFPPREFLNTIAKIRDMVGIFLDARV